MTKMSQWSRIIELNLYSEIIEYYNNHFAIEVRMSLAAWLEYYIYSPNVDLNSSNPQDVKFFEEFMRQLLEELKNEIDRMILLDNYGVSYKYRLEQERYRISTTYQNNGVGLFRMIKSCLDHEQTVIQNYLHRQSASVSNQPIAELKSRLSQIVPGILERTRIDESYQITQDIGNIIDNLGSTRHALNNVQAAILDANLQVNGFHDRQQLQIQLISHRSIEIEQMQSFKGHMDSFLLNTKGTLDDLESIQKDVLHELENYKIEENYSSNGYPVVTRCLEKISELANMLAKGFVQIHKQLIQAEMYIQSELPHGYSPDDALIVQEMNKRKMDLTSLLQKLVIGTFIVEKLPGQILRLKATPIKPAIKVRLLVGGVLNPNFKNKVTVSLINEEEAKKVHRNPHYNPVSSILQLTKQHSMELMKSKVFGAEFTGIILPERPKQSKGSGRQKSEDDDTQFVTETKYCFYFSCIFTCLEQSFTIYTTSAPVTLTKHPCQNPDAWATILWDSAFAEPNRIPFEVSKDIDLSKLMDVLDKHFSSQTGRALTENNRKFLSEKLMRGNATNNTKATWDLFFKRPLEGCLQPAQTKPKGSNRPPSFHSWLFAIMEVFERSNESTKTVTLQRLWQDGKIEGFISREDMEQKLKSCVSGNFMIRVSDTLLGAVTINWYNHEAKQIEKFEPFTLEALKTIPLENRILNNPHLLFLYPNTTKSNAFSEVTVEDKTKWKLLQRGYFLTKLEQATVNIPPRTRQPSSSSHSSATTSSPSASETYPSPFTPTSSLGGSPQPGSSTSGFGSPMQRHQEGGQTFEDSGFDITTPDLDFYTTGLELAGLSFEPESD